MSNNLNLTSKITPELLVKLNVPLQFYRVFFEEWPNGMEVVPANIERAIDIGLDMDLLAYKIFNNIEIHRKYIQDTEMAAVQYREFSEDRQIKARARAIAFVMAYIATLSEIDRTNQKK